MLSQDETQKPINMGWYLQSYHLLCNPSKKKHRKLQKKSNRLHLFAKKAPKISLVNSRAPLCKTIQVQEMTQALSKLQVINHTRSILLKFNLTLLRLVELNKSHQIVSLLVKSSQWGMRIMILTRISLITLFRPKSIRRER